MADQATIGSNGRSAPHQAAKSISGLLHDLIALCELQAKLATCDFKEMLRGLILPAILAVVIVLMLLGAIFTCFLAGAYALVDFAGWSHVASFSTSAAAGLGTAVLLAVVVWMAVRGSVGKLNRSREEFSENLKAFKAMLKDHEGTQRTKA